MLRSRKSLIFLVLAGTSCLAQASPTSDLISLMKGMAGGYEASGQTAEDKLPSGQVVSQEVDGRIEAEITIYGSTENRASMDVSYPGEQAERYTMVTPDGDDHVVITQEDTEYTQCASTVRARVVGNGFEFAKADVVFSDNSAESREYCLDPFRWPYPLHERYRWEYDGQAKKVRVISWGDFDDLDEVHKFRKLTMEFGAQ